MRQKVEDGWAVCKPGVLDGSSLWEGVWWHCVDNSAFFAMIPLCVFLVQTWFSGIHERFGLVHASMHT